MDGQVDLGYWRGALIRVLSSLLCAGVFYFAWMAVFLVVVKPGPEAVEAILWLLAPLVTAFGFAAGIVLLEKLTKVARTNFSRLIPWPMIGCVIGAGLVYWFGPMLIVFGMFVAGTASMVLREVSAYSKAKHV